SLCVALLCPGRDNQSVALLIKQVQGSHRRWERRLQGTDRAPRDLLGVLCQKKLTAHAGDPRIVRGWSGMRRVVSLPADERRVLRAEIGRTLLFREADGSE